MKHKLDISQFFLLLALGIGFLLPVFDRFGWLGQAGVNGTSWGNWQNFVAYTNTLMPYMNSSATNVMAALATVGETVFGIALIVGYKTRLASFSSFFLTLLFALSMFFFTEMRAPFTYSVFVDSAASLLLASLTAYRWSIDEVVSLKKIKFS